MKFEIYFLLFSSGRLHSTCHEWFKDEDEWRVRAKFWQGQGYTVFRIVDEIW